MIKALATFTLLASKMLAYPQRARRSTKRRAAGLAIDGDDLWCPHFLQTIKPLLLEDEGI